MLALTRQHLRLKSLTNYLKVAPMVPPNPDFAIDIFNMGNYEMNSLFSVPSFGNHSVTVVLPIEGADLLALSTRSGDYTLWLYYHRLNEQTLYTCLNNFVEPKLRQVSESVNQLRGKGSTRTRGEEKEFERLPDFEQELQ